LRRQHRELKSLLTRSVHLGTLTMYVHLTSTSVPSLSWRRSNAKQQYQHQKSAGYIYFVRVHDISYCDVGTLSDVFDEIAAGHCNDRRPRSLQRIIPVAASGTSATVTLNLLRMTRIPRIEVLAWSCPWSRNASFAEHEDKK